MKGLPFEFVMTSQNKAAKQPEYLAAVNPRGTIPAIDDDGFVLWESHAILIYLCEKHGWTDLWPDDLQQRSVVNQYLHFHHRNTREIVVQWSRTLWPALFGVRNPDDNWLKRNTFAGMQNNAEIVNDMLAIVDGMLEANTFITGARLTLADISAYEELGQNQAKYANCSDYTIYPNIQRWLRQMGEVPCHEQAHRVWVMLGDLNQLDGSGMGVLAKANKEAAALFQATADTFTQ